MNADNCGVDAPEDATEQPSLDIEPESFVEALQTATWLARLVLSAETLTEFCHGVAAECGWWTDLQTGESLIGKRNVGELLCLVHSEISEAMEGHRKDLQDDKLPHRKMFEVELADALIRIFDIAGAMKLNLADAVYEKLLYNANRADHKPENRLAEGGKKY